MEFLKKPFSLPEKREALFALTISAIIWGANAPISKWALASSSIATLGFLRFFIAFFIFYFIFKPDLRVKKQDIPLMIMANVIGISIHIPILYLGLSLTNSINAALIASSVPIISLFFTKFLLNEKISKRFIIGGLIGMTGVIFIILQPAIEHGISTNVIGNIILLFSAFTFIISEVFSKKLLKKEYKPTTIVTYGYLAGITTFLPFFAMDVAWNGTYFLNQNFIIGLMYIVIFSSLIAIPSWQWALSKLEVSRVGFFLYLDPVVASIVAFFLLGEVITTTLLLGAVLIFAGLYVAENTIHLPHFHLLHAHLKRRNNAK